jgi:hypothetical protein
MNINNRFSVSLALCLVLAALMITGSTETTMVFASHNSTSPSNTGSPSSTPSSSVSSGSSGSTSTHSIHAGVAISWSDLGRLWYTCICFRKKNVPSKIEEIRNWSRSVIQPIAVGLISYQYLIQYPIEIITDREYDPIILSPGQTSVFHLIANQRFLKSLRPSE